MAERVEAVWQAFADLYPSTVARIFDASDKISPKLGVDAFDASKKLQVPWDTLSSG